MPYKRRRRSTLKSLTLMIGSARNIFSQFITERNKCEENKIRISVKKEDCIVEFILLSMDLGKKEHRCDCIIFGITKKGRLLSPFIAIVELKSRNADITHAISQIEACCEILNRIDQQFCRRYIQNGNFLPIIVAESYDSIIYKIMHSKRVDFNGQRKMIKLETNNCTLNEILL